MPLNSIQQQFVARSIISDHESSILVSILVPGVQHASNDVQELVDSLSASGISEMIAAADAGSESELGSDPEVDTTIPDTGVFRYKLPREKRPFFQPLCITTPHRYECRASEPLRSFNQLNDNKWVLQTITVQSEDTDHMEVEYATPQ